jgi:hypothetical protein
MCVWESAVAAPIRDCNTGNCLHSRSDGEVIRPDTHSVHLRSNRTQEAFRHATRWTSSPPRTAVRLPRIFTVARKDAEMLNVSPLWTAFAVGGA